jgi:colanic acid/amylovoran biosynthesis protein
MGPRAMIRRDMNTPSVRRLLLIGQCTLHWGRMEFGNIGNYYILEPLITELHRVFPHAQIRTTFQLSEAFCRQFDVTVLPMSLYYDWDQADLERAEVEVEQAHLIVGNGRPPQPTPYLIEALDADLVVDFSGDIWGDNAHLLGPNRFRVGLLKDRTAQILGKPVVMIAGSAGPFTEGPDLTLAREVFANFLWVSNREAMSREVLAAAGFRTDHVTDCACPAFLFQPASPERAQELLRDEEGPPPPPGKLVVTFVICGWNFARGPFDAWPRADEEFTPFVAMVRHLIERHGAFVRLLSHANGFPPPPADFQLQTGRDYVIAERLHQLLLAADVGPAVRLLHGPFTPAETKALIARSDLLVAGRIHAAVAGISQCIPTVIIDYGHQPKAHKLRGIAQSIGMEQMVVDPLASAVCEKIDWAISNAPSLRALLTANLPRTLALARANFELLPGQVEHSAHGRRS